MEIMDAATPALSVGLALRGHPKGAKEGVEAAMRAMTECAEPGAGDENSGKKSSFSWRRSARAAAAVGRAVHPTEPDAAIRADAVAADALLARLRQVAAQFPSADAKSGKSQIRFSRERMSSVLEIVSEADWVFAESAGAAARARASPPPPRTCAPTSWSRACPSCPRRRPSPPPGGEPTSR